MTDAKNKTNIGLPAYVRIEQDLRRRVETGIWQPGMVLPSRRALAAEYNVQLPTLQRAISDLLKDGTLESKPRHGTVVGKVGSPGRPKKSAPGQVSFKAPAPASGRCHIGILALLPDNWADESDDWHHRIVTSIEHVVSDAAGATIVYNRGSGEAAQLDFDFGMRKLVDSGAQAIIILAPSEMEAVQHDTARAAAGSTVPAVVISSAPLDLPAPHVYYDQFTAGFQAAQHLINEGVDEPVIFFSPFQVDWADQRRDGASKAFVQAGLSAAFLRPYPQNNLPIDFYDDEGRIQAAFEMALEAIREGNWRMGCKIIASNDMVAGNVVRAFTENGMQAGIDYSIIGFDDNRVARRLGLTTLRPPIEALGEEAARMALQAVKGESLCIQARLRSRLIVRTSTKPGTSMATPPKKPRGSVLTHI